MKASDLTEQQRETFVDEFYRQWETAGFGDPHTEINGNPLPWGCPWLWGGDLEINGDDIEDMATAFFEDCKPEIGALLKEEWANPNG